MTKGARASDADRPRLMVLGGGQYQLPVITAARTLGAEVLVVDQRADVPGATLGGAFCAVNTTDRASVLALARAARIDGVIAPCTDVAVPTQAFVAAALRLPGPSLETAEILTDKARFRAYQGRRGLAHPLFFVGKAADLSVCNAPDGLYLIKPARSSGSKGVYIVSLADIRQRVPETAGFSADGRIVVEAFIEGAQGTVEGIWTGGEIRFALLTDRMTAAAPFVATKTHLWPSRLPNRIQKEVLSAIADVLYDLGVPDSPFDCDFVIGAAGPVILEMSPRLGGNSLSRLVWATSGKDLPALAVGLALTPAAASRLSVPAEVPPLSPAAAVMILGVPTAGRLTLDAAGVAGLQREPWLAVLEWDVAPGDRVRAFANGRDRIGEALVLAPDRDVLDARCADLDARLTLSTVSAGL